MLCYAITPILCLIYKSPSMRLSTYRIIPKLLRYIQFPQIHARFNAMCVCTLVPHPYVFACSMRQNSALHDVSQLSNSLASTAGDSQSRLQVSTRIHQTPFVLPFLARRIETRFPWLIESFEPKMTSSISGMR